MNACTCTCLFSEKALDNYHISDKFDILDNWLKRGLRGARGMPIGVQVHKRDDQSEVLFYFNIL